MMDLDTAKRLAGSLVSAWNSRDIGRILDHYSDDVRITNPLYATLLGAKDGTIQGKESLRGFWMHMLEELPHTRYTIFGVYVGVQGFAINYQGLFEKKYTQTFQTDEHGKIFESYTYLDSLELP